MKKNERRPGSRSPVANRQIINLEARQLHVHKMSRESSSALRLKLFDRIRNCHQARRPDG
jgi:hypothetical protein